ncbi:MAG: TlpA disulfide reductase family protein [Porphyromonadaceae bacterium]|nr:TlpA disulfide reductase family protein [Porphyromonadaceae bacterium]
MKKITLSILTAFVLFACGKTTDLKINGTVELDALEGQKVYLTDNNLTPFDSTEIKKGKFTFKSAVDSTKMVNMLISNENANPIARLFIYEKGEININIAKNGDVAVTGTPMNDVYSDFWRQNKELDKKYENALRISEKAASEVDKEYVELGYKFAKENAKNLVGKIAFLSSYWGMSIEQREDVLSVLDESFKQDKKIAKIISNIEQEKKSSIGQPFIDFTAQDVKGNDIALNSLVGKTDYLLIDFWASWCGPCIKSLPSLKALYDKYKGKRFDIIGVSLDSKKEDWVGAIEKFQLKWTNISDLKQWESHPAKLYAVSFIPNTILIDKEGKIVGRNLHVNEIEEILNKK